MQNCSESRLKGVCGIIPSAYPQRQTPRLLLLSSTGLFSEKCSCRRFRKNPQASPWSALTLFLPPRPFLER